VRALHADTGRILRPAKSVVGYAAQAYSALWLGRGRPSARCAHGPSSVLTQKPFKNLKNSFSIFIQFQTKFKLQKLVSKYPELQNYEISSVGFVTF
jgi:hypothetical protein